MTQHVIKKILSSAYHKKEKMRPVVNLCRKYKGVLPSSQTTESYESEVTRQISVKLLALGGEFATCHETFALLMFSRHYIFNGSTLRVYANNVPKECPLVCVAIFDTSRDGRLSFECIHLISRTQWQKATFSDVHYKSFQLKHLLTISLIALPEDNQPLSGSPSSDDVMAMQIERSTLTKSTACLEAEAAQEYTGFQPFFLASQFQHLVDLSIQATTATGSQEEEDDDDEDEAPQLESSTTKDEEAYHYADNRTPYLSYYVQFTIDVCLFQRCFAKHYALKKKMMLHYQTSIKARHHDTMFLFLAQMIERSSKQKTYQAHVPRKEVNHGEILAHLIEADWHREWLATEIFLFHACQWHSVLEKSGNRVNEHVAFMRARVPEVFWSNWYAYEENGLYWQEDVENGLFRVKVEWLYREEFASILTSQPFIKGFAYLTREAFARLFMPALYRLLLEDCFVYLFLVYRSKSDEFNLERYDLQALRVSFQYSDVECHDIHAALKNFKLTNAIGLFDCVAEAGNPSSPVIRKWFKTRPEFDLSGDCLPNDDSRRIAWQYNRLARETMPDIEDLASGKALPACMRQIMTRATPFKIGNTDRINLMRPLIELAYNREEAVNFFGKRTSVNHEHAAYVGDMSTTYDYFEKVRRSQMTLTGTSCQSFGCTSIINVKPDKKNVFTCPYAQRERQKEPGNTRKFEWEEKKMFMNECAATLSRPLESGVYLQHPVQYVMHQLNK
jgi:hypothetical protein